MARRRRPEEPKPDPSDPPAWLWQFRFSDWAHIEFPPEPEDFFIPGYRVHHADGASFWDYCRAREHWREQAAAWLRDNDRYLWPHWPENRDDFKRMVAEQPQKVLRHDRDRPRGMAPTPPGGAGTAEEGSGVPGGFRHSEEGL